ncbi:MAG: Xaa-Pro peptidase family protein [Gammaproteobacteria bacterium]
MDVITGSATDAKLPFDQDRLDRLMDEAGIDVLVATGKHTVQYLLGGYRYIVFHSMDPIGHSRYLPIVIYQKATPERAAYIGNAMETHEHEVNPFWTPEVHLKSWGTEDAAAQAAGHLKALGLARARIGVEPSFLPYDALQILQQELGSPTLVNATPMLERMRAVKTPQELHNLRRASELVTDSMLAVVASHGEGATKAEMMEALRREETNRGLHFEYALVTMGTSHNRAASDQAWRKGDPMSIDSGGNYHGYTGDICRMAVLGEPDAELQDLLAELENVQQAAFTGIRAGVLGAELISRGDAALEKSPIAPHTDFFAHGMGLVFHEAPFLVTNRPMPYEGADAERPLEAGMVISVETTMKHPRRGFIKLEDTVAVTADGYDMYGTRGRGWNIAATG